jgi:hypothetical protein
MTEEAVAVEVRAPEPAVMAECKAALSDVYAPTLQRMHKVLDELRCVALRAHLNDVDTCRLYLYLQTTNTSLLHRTALTVHSTLRCRAR